MFHVLGCARRVSIWTWHYLEIFVRHLGICVIVSLFLAHMWPVKYWTLARWWPYIYVEVGPAIFTVTFRAFVRIAWLLDLQIKSVPGSAVASTPWRVHLLEW